MATAYFLGLLQCLLVCSSHCMSLASPLVTATFDWLLHVSGSLHWSLHYQSSECLLGHLQQLSVSNRHWMSLIRSTGLCQSVPVSSSHWRSLADLHWSLLDSSDHWMSLADSTGISVSDYWSLVVTECLLSHLQCLLVRINHCIYLTVYNGHYQSALVSRAHCMSPTVSNSLL